MTASIRHSHDPEEDAVVLVSSDGADRIAFSRSLHIGRHPLNDMVLGHPRISARHATIEWTPDGWMIRDLGSSNGTSVNGRGIRSPRRLEVGDEIRFGNVSAWVVRRVGTPPDDRAARALVEFEASSRQVPVLSDRFLIGTGDPCDLQVPEWADGRPAIRLVLYEESGALRAEPAANVGSITLDDRPWTAGEVVIDAPVSVCLGPTRLRLIPAPDRGAFDTTDRGAPRTKVYDLDLFLEPVAPGEGVIRVVHEGHEWMVRTGQRFMLLFLLGRAGGQWIRDDELRRDLWGRAGTRDMDPSTLHKLIYDTRQLFLSHGIDGWFIEKNAGRTRLRLAAGRIHVMSGTGP